MVSVSRPPLTLREVSTWRRTKSSSSCPVSTGMPLWFGANTLPR